MDKAYSPDVFCNKHRTEWRVKAGITSNISH